MIVLAILCLVASAAFAEEFQPMTRVLHRENDVISRWPVPTSLEEATAKSWVESELPPNAQAFFDETVTLYTRPEAKTLGMYFNENGVVVGFNYALDEAHYKNVKTDFARAGFTSWETTVNGTTATYQSTLAKYVCSGEGTERVCDAIQYRGLDGEVAKVSMDISNNPEFTQEKCFETAGVVYFRDMSSSLTAENFDSWYFLTNCEGVVIGAGVMFFAERAVEKAWWWPVRWDAEVMADSIKEVPAWMNEYSTSPGIEGFEFWFIDNPEEFQCSSCA